MSDTNPQDRVVGIKQTMRAVREGAAHIVHLATDAEERVTVPLRLECEAAGIETVCTQTMRELGDAFGIAIGAAAAAVLKDR